jgi:hypothetical protein
MRDLGLTGEVSGFGFSPTLFRRLRESGKDLGLLESLELPEEFTPSALLAHVPLAAMPYPDNAVAHEVGHARGLVHTSDPSNLMHPNVGAHCRAALTSDQLDALAGLVAPEQPNAGSSAARAADAQLGVLLDVHRSATLQALEWRAAEAGSK